MRDGGGGAAKRVLQQEGGIQVSYRMPMGEAAAAAGEMMSDIDASFASFATLHRICRRLRSSAYTSTRHKKIAQAYKTNSFD